MRKPLIAAALAAAAVFSLTACEKPAPAITVFSGSNSVHAEAVCWDVDCAELPAGATPATLAVTPGATLGISVDSEVAEAGWRPAILVDGQWQPLEQRTITKRYWRMTFPEGTRGSFPEGGFLLQIVSGAAATGESGVWSFTLTDAESVDNA